MQKFETQIDTLKIVISKMNQEGDGLWSRFNYLASVQLALLGAFVLTFQNLNSENNSALLPLGIAVLGLIMGFLTYRTLARMTAWHSHWAARCIEIDQAISSNFDTPSIFPTEELRIQPTKYLTGPLPIIGVFIFAWFISLTQILWTYWAVNY